MGKLRTQIDELMYITRDIDSDMSSCIKGLNMKMCKRLITAIPEKFLFMFANSMNYGIFPSDWAVSTVTLLPKTGNKTNPGNWRPISNTNIFAKVLEKLVQKQVSRYIFANKLISEFQYGFVPGRSTHESVFKFIKHIYSAINNGKITGVLFLDIAKAFNCINHDILNIVMANNGFDKRVRKWFRSYNNRFQCVKIGDSVSDTRSVLYGAAQGTVLGPTLFILYFNAVAEHVSKCKVSLFADDCIIYQSGNTWESVRMKLQYDLDNVLLYTATNSLTLNGSKTQTMVIGTKSKLNRIDTERPVCISNNPVKFVKQYNYLGVIIDNEMTIQPMLKHVKKLVTNKIFVLRKIRKFLTEKAAVSIYKQTILPIIDYAGFLLLACNVSDRSDLQKMQNDILRICYKAKLSDQVSIKELHNRSKMLSLEQRMRKQLLWLMYIDSLNVNNRKITNRVLRSNDKYIFKVDIKIGTKYQHSPYYKGTLLWNELPASTQMITDIVRFKQLISRNYRVYENLL